MNRIGFLAIGALTTLWLGAGPAAAEPTVRCQQAKINAHGSLEKCLAKSTSGGLVGKPDKTLDCRAKFFKALAKADAKATKAGTSCRYVDNNDGTVSDLNTGLIWEKKDGTCPGLHCDGGASFSADTSGKPSGDLFTDFLYGLNGGMAPNAETVSGCFTDHCDWRIPSVIELQTIRIDPCSATPCMDPIFGTFSPTFYWTSSAHPTAGWGWYVSFADGDVFVQPRDAGANKRAVRGVMVEPLPPVEEP